MSARDEQRHADLRGIYVESGISGRSREPFCRVAVQYAERGSGKVLEAVGQLTPQEVRSMARQWMEAAEAAIHDASVFHLLIDEVGLPESGAASFVASLRAHRADADEMTEGP
jgi:ribosomal protein S16